MVAQIRDKWSHICHDSQKFLELLLCRRAGNGLDVLYFSGIWLNTVLPKTIPKKTIFSCLIAHFEELKTRPSSSDTFIKLMSLLNTTTSSGQRHAVETETSERGVEGSQKLTFLIEFHRPVAMLGVHFTEDSATA